MEKLFEKILPRIFLALAFVAFIVSFIVAIVNPIGVFQLIFESVFQYTQNKIFSFSFSFSSIFFFFYAIFHVGYMACLWFKAKKYEQDLIDQKIALKICKCHNEIQKELYKCYSEKQNKIPRTNEFDYWIGCLGLRDFFEPTKDDYIVKPYVLRVIKKYHEIAFQSIYWQQNK
ncbi:hypothetical protein [Helicobacter pylori]|uniref:Uncharacterized protein n=1 Tax=Helicobacter pylori Aklavik86 TaxID=1055532 RepID=K7YL79_HELPX|nr:hypothetical protein [Helicobacter pylori]AFX89087.1 hypothetical protein HPAKL86_00285 [Helicobacter pylori Aklavik86]WQS14360.1 hypothetical protein KVD76_00320 [Helicobacter pylori]WQS24099.1 hypothetical protein KVD61_00325 [Helicobacter pylori]